MSGLIFARIPLASSELIGYMDLTDFEETWPKCFLVIKGALSRFLRIFGSPQRAPVTTNVRA